MAPLPRWLAAALSIFLLGCQSEGIGRAGSPAWFATSSEESIISHYQKQCAAYGYQAGTPQMAQCTQQEVNNARSRSSQRIASAYNTYALMQAAQPAIAPQPTFRTTNCQRYGSTVSCQSF